MDKDRVAQLMTLSYSAYKAEFDGKMAEALQLHSTAAKDWLAFEQTGSFFSTEEREYKRFSKIKADFHRERIATLGPFASASTPPTALVQQPSVLTLAKGLTPQEVPNGSASTSPPPVALSIYEMTAPQQVVPGLPCYTTSLPPGLPTETYVIQQTTKWAKAFNRWVMYTVRDASEAHTLYIGEACMAYKRQIPLVTFYRAGDYPTPAFAVVPAPVRPKQASYEIGSGFKGRTMTIRCDALPREVVETPDRAERQPWGPRRLVYGGRRFVWKVGDKSEDLRPESLHEYTATKPKPGSRTGKKDDDALETRLFWSDKMPFVQLHAKWTVHCVGGLDPLFKEMMFASQIAKLVCMYTALD